MGHAMPHMRQPERRSYFAISQSRRRRHLPKPLSRIRDCLGLLAAFAISIPLLNGAVMARDEGLGSIDAKQGAFRARVIEARSHYDLVENASYRNALFSLYLAMSQKTPATLLAELDVLLNEGVQDHVDGL